jgi:hypothetical protein
MLSFCVGTIKTRNSSVARLPVVPCSRYPPTAESENIATDFVQLILLLDGVFMLNFETLNIEARRMQSTADEAETLYRLQDTTVSHHGIEIEFENDDYPEYYFSEAIRDRLAHDNTLSEVDKMIIQRFHFPGNTFWQDYFFWYATIAHIYLLHAFQMMHTALHTHADNQKCITFIFIF